MKLAILADIHEDHQRLERVLRRADREGYDRLVCLGDIAGFNNTHYRKLSERSAHKAIEMLRSRDAIVVPGNHDYHLVQRIPAVADVFDFPIEWYSMEYRERKQISADRIWLHEEDLVDPQITEADLAFLGSLEEFRIINTGDLNVLLSHYAFPNLAGFEKGFYDTPSDFTEHFNFMQRHHCQVSFTGHAHIRGFYLAEPRNFRQYAYRSKRLKYFPVCIGVPPVASNSNRSGFCIFDTERLSLSVIRS